MWQNGVSIAFATICHCPEPLWNTLAAGVDAIIIILPPNVSSSIAAGLPTSAGLSVDEYVSIVLPTVARVGADTVYSPAAPFGKPSGSSASATEYDAIISGGTPSMISAGSTVPDGTIPNNSRRYAALPSV